VVRRFFVVFRQKSGEEDPSQNLGRAWRRELHWNEPDNRLKLLGELGTLVRLRNCDVKMEIIQELR
jgi:hypothetical protein